MTTGVARTLVGVPAAPGLVVGAIVQLRHDPIEIPQDHDSPNAERLRLECALEQARTELRSLQERLAQTADATRAAIFAAHEALLGDPDLLATCATAIDRGGSAAFAWHLAIETQARRLANLDDKLLAARASDVRDVGRRVLRAIVGTKGAERHYAPGTILVAEDLTPSETAGLDRSTVVGFCTAGGGATSHVAILARSLDIPAVAAIDPAALDVPDGTPAVLDGNEGVLRLVPSPEELASVAERLARDERRRAAERAVAHQPASTVDGHSIAVVGNIGSLADAEQVLALGGEGVGLLRTEFLFLDRDQAPSEDEQADVYTAIAARLGPGRPLIIRTLDAGGDKALPFLHLPKEHNPSLGERGIRAQLARPTLLRAQLRAIVRAARHGQVMVMFPMITGLAQWRVARQALERERLQLGSPPVPVGVLVEVPATALNAERFATEVDFFSLGTNDLAQYTLATDRDHPQLASQVDELDPAVLQLVATTVKAARGHGKWVSICGGMAADPQAIPLLIGLGVGGLSVSAPAIPGVKACVRRWRLADAEVLATRALSAGSAEEVRALVAAADA
jgi:phosphocarrier protein FPr